jgi:hypothetical protein
MILQAQDPLSATSPIAAGVLWSYLIPALLFIVSVLSTYWLYRKFSIGRHE